MWAAYVISDEELVYNYKQGDFRYFKIDFAVLDSYDVIERTVGNARKLIDSSGHSVRINWDVTENPPRVGYYFAKEFGNVYLENRKPEKPERVIYVPYLVLRDAWQLARYTNLNKFQIGFPNIDMVSQEKSNAYLYNHPYCLTITFMGSPLFFQETKYLSEEAREQIKPLLRLYKRHQREMFGGYVFAIGEIPNDRSWTGFQCHVPHQKAGYLTLFRELYNTETHMRLQLKFLAGNTVRLLDLTRGTQRSVEVPESGEIVFSIEEPAGFAYLRYDVLN